MAGDLIPTVLKEGAEAAPKVLGVEVKREAGNLPAKRATVSSSSSNRSMGAGWLMGTSGGHMSGGPCCLGGRAFSFVIGAGLLADLGSSLKKTRKSNGEKKQAKKASTAFGSRPRQRPGKRAS